MWIRVGKIADKQGITRHVWAYESELRTLYRVAAFDIAPDIATFGDYANGYWEISVNEGNRRRGIGGALLKFVEERRGRLFDKPRLTPMGELFWASRTNSFDNP